jgi:hypothetical protein
MKNTLKAALTTAAKLYTCPQTDDSPHTSSFPPVQLNVRKVMEISGIEGRAVCETYWIANFYRENYTDKVGLILLKGDDAAKIYFAIKHYSKLDTYGKINLAHYVEEIESNWDNKNTRIETRHHKETKAIIRGLRP